MNGTDADTRPLWKEERDYVLTELVLFVLVLGAGAYLVWTRGDTFRPIAFAGAAVLGAVARYAEEHVPALRNRTKLQQWGLVLAGLLVLLGFQYLLTSSQQGSVAIGVGAGMALYRVVYGFVLDLPPLVKADIERRTQP